MECSINRCNFRNAIAEQMKASAKPFLKRKKKRINIVSHPRGI